MVGTMAAAGLENEKRVANAIAAAARGPVVRVGPRPGAPSVTGRRTTGSTTTFARISRPAPGEVCQGSPSLIAPGSAKLIATTKGARGRPHPEGVLSSTRITGESLRGPCQLGGDGGLLSREFELPGTRMAMGKPQPDDLMTTGEAGRLLGLSADMGCWLENEGRLPAQRTTNGVALVQAR